MSSGGPQVGGFNLVVEFHRGGSATNQRCAVNLASLDHRDPFSFWSLNIETVILKVMIPVLISGLRF